MYFELVVLGGLVLFLTNSILPTRPPVREAFETAETSMIKTVIRTLYFLYANQTFSGVLVGLNNPKVLNNLTLLEDSQSFTINKRVIHLCTKDDAGKFYDTNSLIYVVLHELAHVLCPEIGHTFSFLKINEALLNHAERRGVYNPKKPFVNNYCP
jgi:hypothetical protein